METEQFVQSADGTEIFTSAAGSGVPVVLCDGIGCDGFIWRYLKPALVGGYQVVRWHYRGHGLSRAARDPDAYRIEDLCTDLLAVLDAHQIDKCVLFGHSMGVQVVLEFAHRFPDRVAGIVPICGSYGNLLDTFKGSELGSMVFPVVRDLVFGWPGAAQTVWSRMFLSGLAYWGAVLLEVNGKVIRRNVMAPYFDHLASMDPAVFMKVLDSARHHSMEDRLAELPQPVLVVAGDRDSFTPGWLSRRMQSLIPDAELLMVPGGTHVAPLEIPELITLRVERFLESRMKPLFGPVTRSSSRKGGRAKSATKKQATPTATSSSSKSVSSGQSARSKAASCDTSA